MIISNYFYHRDAENTERYWQKLKIIAIRYYWLSEQVVLIGKYRLNGAMRYYWLSEQVVLIGEYRLNGAIRYYWLSEQVVLTIEYFLNGATQYNWFRKQLLVLMHKRDANLSELIKSSI